MALSPMMEHYLSVKEKYPDCVVFYRLGDFYEMFFEDATRVSGLLDLTLTGRDCGLKERAPMCGIPYHAADAYIAKLVSLGERVAICEQLSDPKTSKGMVDRDVIRVVSAGTVIEESLLDEKRSNYIACACKKGGKYALAWADITTGELCAGEEENAEKLVSTLVALSVSEIILNDDLLFEIKELLTRERSLPAPSCYVSRAFEKASAERAVCEQLDAASTDALGFQECPVCVCAVGALFEYLKETQKHALKNFNTVKFRDGDKAMKLDPIALRNLEIVKNNADGKTYGSLLWVLDKTRTGMGARKLASFLVSPLCDRVQIDYRLNAVEELCNASVVRMGIYDTLGGVRDIERLTGRVANGNLQPRDCLSLAQSLALVPSLKFQLAGFNSAMLKEISEELIDTKEICDLLERAISPEATTVKEGNYIRRGYNRQLDELKEIKNDGKSLISKLETRERESTGIRTLRVGYNRVFGYYIEVSKSFLDKVPYTYIRRQTLTNGERFTTEELQALETKIISSDDQSVRLEEHLYNELKEILIRNIALLQQISSAIALLDCITSFAIVSTENKYCRPEITEGDKLEITEGRHPVVESISRDRFVPNDSVLDCNENRTAIITGPNMAGKSTYLRQTALIVLMAHVGCFVPAKRAVIPLCDRIFTRIGASDNLILDRSTFMVEMTEVANILRNASKRSLLILDEVGRGTSTYDGLSIAQAVIEYINDKIGAKTLFATHYHELTELEGKLGGVKNYKVSVREIAGKVVFLRKIVRGGASRSFGVEVAQIAGVPVEVTLRAKAILRSLEKRGGKTPVQEEEYPEERAQSELDLRAELEETDVNALTPLQALALISEWKEKLK